MNTQNIVFFSFHSPECWDVVYLLNMQVRYTGYRDRPLAERRLCLQSECREGHAPIVSDIQILQFRAGLWVGYMLLEWCCDCFGH